MLDICLLELYWMFNGYLEDYDNFGVNIILIQIRKIIDVNRLSILFILNYIFYNYNYNQDIYIKLFQIL